MKGVILEKHDIKLIELKKFKDDRGAFVKTFQKSIFTETNEDIEWKEEFFSISKKNVFRGFHFQEPPHEQWKLVSCYNGNIIDYIVDLRCSSPTYGKLFEFNLIDSEPNCILIPPGFAHGFYSLVNNTIVHYKVSSEYQAHKDKGIHWKSVKKDFSKAIISERDSSFPLLKDYTSPF